MAIICDDGNHYDFITDGCVLAPLVRQDENVEVVGSSRVSEISVESEEEFDRTRLATESEYLGQFEVFPNPANNEVFVSLNVFAGRAAQISIMHTLGQLLEVRNIDALPQGKIRMDLSNLTTGVYLVRMEVEGEQEMTKRLVVNKGE